MGALGFYFDFASPYAWIAFDAAERTAQEAGLRLDLRPILIWAVLKEQGIAAPMEAPARRRYMLADMARSAAFMGVELHLPEPLQMSSHLAARLWLGMRADYPERAVEIARRLYVARFVEARDLADRAVLLQIAAEFGTPPETAQVHLDAPDTREALAASIRRAIEDGACGAPYFTLGDEGFFGADRLAQLRWRLGLA